MKDFFDIRQDGERTQDQRESTLPRKLSDEEASELPPEFTKTLRILERIFGEELDIKFEEP